MKGVYYATPHYAAFSSLSEDQSFSPTLCSHMSWITLLPQKVNFIIHTEQQGKLCFCENLTIYFTKIHVASVMNYNLKARSCGNSLAWQNQKL